MSIQVGIIPITILSGVWPMVEQHLAKATKYAEGEFVTHDLLHWALERRGQIWGMYDTEGGGFVAAAYTEVVEYARFSVLRVVAVGGKKMSTWLEAFINELNQFCLAHRLERIEEAGRKGWLRRLGKYGFRPAYQVMIKPVNI